MRMSNGIRQYLARMELEAATYVRQSLLPTYRLPSCVEPMNVFVPEDPSDGGFLPVFVLGADNPDDSSVDRWIP